MSSLSIHHINIDTAIPDETIAFYEKVLGLKNRPELRASSRRPGAWLFTGDHPIVHLHFVEEVSSDTGPFNHVAFLGHNFDETVRHLNDCGVEFRQQRSEAMDQLFFFDPNGVRIELNFPGTTTAVDGRVDSGPAQ